LLFYKKIQTEMSKISLWYGAGKGFVCFLHIPDFFLLMFVLLWSSLIYINHTNTWFEIGNNFSSQLSVKLKCLKARHLLAQHGFSLSHVWFL